MSYFSELDLDIRNYFKTIPHFYCEKCGGRLGIIGFIPPNIFRAICKNKSCQRYALAIEVTPHKVEIALQA